MLAVWHEGGRSESAELGQHASRFFAFQPEKRKRNYATVLAPFAHRFRRCSSRKDLRREASAQIEAARHVAKATFGVASRR